MTEILLSSLQFAVIFAVGVLEVSGVMIFGRNLTLSDSMVLLTPYRLCFNVHSACLNLSDSSPKDQPKMI